MKGLIYIVLLFIAYGTSAATFSEQARLKRGATFFMNYCSGCHTLRYMRPERMVNDLSSVIVSPDESEPRALASGVPLPDGRGSDSLNYPSLMVNSMPETDARQWFGRMPPDLSLVARERGSAWLYRYLTSFYADHTRPFGANNTLVPDVGMPNVLAPLAGQVQLAGDVHDVVSFLVYVSEPTKDLRHRTGFVVLVFLAILGWVVYQLKCLYWREIR